MKVLGNEQSRKYADTIVSKNLSSTILFYGPKGIGKWTYALELASTYFNDCNIYKFSVEGKQCSHCVSSSQILLEHAFSFPLVGNRVCFIFDEADRMSLNVVSRLLKIAEEPDRRIVIILISNKPNFVPKTILSRSTKIPFFPLTKNELSNITKNDYSCFFGSPGKIIALDELKKLNGINICKQLTSFPLNWKSFLACISNIEIFYKELLKLESDFRLSIQEMFWEFLLICLGETYFKHGIRVSKIATRLFEAIHAVNRGINISIPIRQIWIELGFIDFSGSQR